MADQKRRRKKKGGKQHGRTNAEWASEYGWSLAFIKAHPQLEQIFNQAVNHTWSPQRFVAAVQDTDWFKKHSDTIRQNRYLQETDPRTYKQRVDQIKQQIKDQAGALGLEVPPNLLDQWAERAFLHGWQDQEVSNHLAQLVDIVGKHSSPVGGTLASTQDQLKQWAMSNGVPIADHTMQQWLRNIVRGDSTMQEYQQYITKMAVAAHPNWKTELEGGMSLAQIAEPYKQTMAQVLEIDPNSIRMNNKMLRQALSFKDDKGNVQSMPMYDFEDMLRNDPRWMNTDNAKQQFMDTGTGILKLFGLAG